MLLAQEKVFFFSAPGFKGRGHHALPLFSGYDACGPLM
ncbi:rCG62240 [Rattus norvegicus]|uniref:RCG62240 n=1 Tax=Rattus norvegicus TaxID=10116 RepID=A6H9U0_RAT|nr:rCG62240 [Rattus norvegicus]